MLQMRKVGIFEDRPGYRGYWRVGRLFKSSHALQPMAAAVVEFRCSLSTVRQGHRRRALTGSQPKPGVARSYIERFKSSKSKG
jgi:hypothetical protein